MAPNPLASTFPKALTPSIRIPRANRSIRLYSGSIRFSQPQKQQEADGLIELAWTPFPRIRFRSDTIPMAQEYAYSCLGAVELQLGNGLIIDQAHITGMYPATMPASNTSFRASLGGTIEAAPTPAIGAKASHVEFLVPQLKTHKGWPIQYAKAHVSCSRHQLTAGGWKIILDELKNYGDTWRHLGEDSGFGITHVGRLERSDHAPFGLEVTRRVLRSLGWYLAFASGRWTGPVLPRGFGTHGEFLWDLWDVWRIAPYRVRETWLHPDLTEPFETPFSGFFDHWSDANLTDVIEIAIHWHIEANAQAGSIEGSIVLTQAAFELLSSALPVHQHAGIAKKKFENLPASVRTMHLFDWAGIPTRLPGEFKDLAAVAKDAPKQDAPSAMAAIRNTITHPTPKNRKKFNKQSDQARYEAWVMSLWYLELCLLRVFEYRGRYRNRCSGKVELVPWAGG